MFCLKDQKDRESNTHRQKHRDVLAKALNILKKSENATLLLLVKMAGKRFLFQFLYCTINI